jgi:predicted RNase H-like HicB family nuclease
MAKIEFHVDVHEEEDGTFWAEVEELPGCFASGFSFEEVQEAVAEAIQLWLPDGIKLGPITWNDVPEPKEPRTTPETGRKRQMLVCA